MNHPAELNRYGLDPEPILEVFDLYRDQVAELVKPLIRRSLWPIAEADPDLICADAMGLARTEALEQLRREVAQDLSRVQRRQPPPVWYELTARGYWTRPVVRMLRETEEGNRAESRYYQSPRR